MTIFFRGVLRPMCILVTAGWRSRQGDSKSKLMVTTSNDVLVHIADFGDDLAVGGDVLAAKGYHKEDGTSGTSASTESDAGVVPEKRRRRGAHHKPRPPIHSAVSGVAVRVQEAATGGYKRIWSLKR